MTAMTKPESTRTDQHVNVCHPCMSLDPTPLIRCASILITVFMLVTPVAVWLVPGPVVAP